MTATSIIAAWLLAAINAWGASPIPQSELAHADEVRQRAADSIVTVAYDADEPPVYQGPNGRGLTAVLLASLAGEESRFLERILTGHCIMPECDGGAATGGMQVHLGRYGMRFLGPKETLCSKSDRDCYTKDDLINDWSLQFRTGVHVYRTQGPFAFTPWRKATAQAHDWVAKHPVPLSDAEVMEE